ncbi:hypothetical protein N656DRAFT_785379 [Canariomyces notabilis]|uniref:Velvet domain-containing protein n=1 Tax=Canariomyces notabilis TaxID=2074819 RepID=A0AAN6QBY0_9PEZI|nr:hypothetical protein N656DRAFT_785379 [Canariomyces arenarius]
MWRESILTLSQPPPAVIERGRPVEPPVTVTLELIFHNYRPADNKGPGIDPPRFSAIANPVDREGKDMARTLADVATLMVPGTISCWDRTAGNTNTDGEGNDKGTGVVRITIEFLFHDLVFRREGEFQLRIRIRAAPDMDMDMDMESECVSGLGLDGMGRSVKSCYTDWFRVVDTE